jgi:hypothetical protein
MTSTAQNTWNSIQSLAWLKLRLTLLKVERKMTNRECVQLTFYQNFLIAAGFAFQISKARIITPKLQNQYVLYPRIDGNLICHDFQNSRLTDSRLNVFTLNSLKSKIMINVIELYFSPSFLTLNSKISKTILFSKVFFCLLQWFSNYVPRHNTVPWGFWKCAEKFQLKKGYIWFFGLLDS